MNTRNKLKFIFCSVISSMFILALLFETDVLAIGCMAGDQQGEFLIVIFLQLLTLCLIPLALRLIRPNTTIKYIEVTQATAYYHRRATFRLVLLSLVFCLNTLFYYLLMIATLGYMALIVLVCLFFIIPTAGRYNKEINYYLVRVADLDE